MNERKFLLPAEALAIVETIDETRAEFALHIGLRTYGPDTLPSGELVINAWHHNAATYLDLTRDQFLDILCRLVRDTSEQGKVICLGTSDSAVRGNHVYWLG